jgi:hypothetical protein
MPLIAASGNNTYDLPTIHTPLLPPPFGLFLLITELRSCIKFDVRSDYFYLLRSFAPA